MHGKVLLAFGNQLIMQLKVLLLIIFVGLMNVDRDAHAFRFLNSRK